MRRVVYHARSAKMLEALNFKWIADGADKSTIFDFYKRQHSEGFATNPSSMRQAGVTDYEGFARRILSHIKVELIGKDLDTYPLETVQMFYDGAIASGYSLPAVLQDPLCCRS